MADRISKSRWPLHLEQGARTESRQTRVYALAFAALAFAVIICALLPSIAQEQRYHQFADQRAWLGIPNAADVLSNLAFVVAGFIGALRLASTRRPRFAPATEAGMACVALGLVATGLGSAWYHYAPTDASLVWDRLAMTVVFAGVVATVIAQRIGNDAGRVSLALLVPAALASVLYWKISGNLTPYALVQVGGLGMLALLVLFTRGKDDPIPWIWVGGLYVLCKLAEIGDRQIYQATGHAIAGHTVKHLLAAAAGAAVFWPLRRRE